MNEDPKEVLAATEVAEVLRCAKNHFSSEHYGANDSFAPKAAGRLFVGKGCRSGWRATRQAEKLLNSGVEKYDDQQQCRRPTAAALFRPGDGLMSQMLPHEFRLRTKRDDLRYLQEFETLNDDSTLTAQEVAQWLRVSPGWVRSHASRQHRPKLPSEEFGNYIQFRWGTLKNWRKSMERFA